MIDNVVRKVVKSSAGGVNIYGLLEPVVCLRQCAIPDELKDASPDAEVVWSGEGHVPRVGATVFVKLNGFGFGRVCGYFVEHGGSNYYLGVYVEPESPPDWWVKQNVRNHGDQRRCCMVFGAEITSSHKAMIARWETRGRKHWMELHRDCLGFTYHGDGFGGNLGDVSLEQAMARMESDVASFKAIDGINMKRVFPLS